MILLKKTVNYDVSFSDFFPICSASNSVSGNFCFNVSGNFKIRIDAINAIIPNVKYGRIAKYTL